VLMDSDGYLVLVAMLKHKLRITQSVNIMFLNTSEETSYLKDSTNPRMMERETRRNRPWVSDDEDIYPPTCMYMTNTNSHLFRKPSLYLTSYQYSYMFSL
jgi:hypothetical protein